MRLKVPFQLEFRDGLGGGGCLSMGVVVPATKKSPLGWKDMHCSGAESVIVLKAFLAATGNDLIEHQCAQLQNNSL
jgi:hypothetical protein